METEFTPLISLFGGFLIGVAAILLMAIHGRVVGMSGIMSGIIPPMATDWQWRAAFLAGAILAPALYAGLGGVIDFAVPMTNTMLVIGGLIVGIGVYFGSGCTSGHGVCGMARFSPRSIAATCVFMVSCGVTVYLIRHVLHIAS